MSTSSSTEGHPETLMDTKLEHLHEVLFTSMQTPINSQVHSSSSFLINKGQQHEQCMRNLAVTWEEGGPISDPLCTLAGPTSRAPGNRGHRGRGPTGAPLILVKFYSHQRAFQFFLFLFFFPSRFASFLALGEQDNISSPWTSLVFTHAACPRLGQVILWILNTLTLKGTCFHISKPIPVIWDTQKNPFELKALQLIQWRASIGPSPAPGLLMAVFLSVQVRS